MLIPHYLKFRKRIETVTFFLKQVGWRKFYDGGKKYKEYFSTANKTTGKVSKRAFGLWANMLTRYELNQCKNVLHFRIANFLILLQNLSLNVLFKLNVKREKNWKIYACCWNDKKQIQYIISNTVIRNQNMCF